MRKTSLNCVGELAKINKDVVFIGSDLGPGVLDEMKHNNPERFFMEGVSEQHIIGMAAGMAMEGFIPYVNTIATFLTRRCYEQIAVDLCLHDLPVKLIANGGGAVYAPLGPTHLAIEDIAILRTLPNMTVLSPCDADEMKRLMKASLDWQHPMYIRLAKGGDKIVSLDDKGFKIGESIEMKSSGDCLFITTGIMTQIALEAAENLSKDGINCGVIHCHTIKPLDTKKIFDVLSNVKIAVTVEEGNLNGGFGSCILEKCSDFYPEFLPKIKRMGIPDEFSKFYGSQNSLLDYWGLNSKNLYAKMKDFLDV